MGEKLVRGDLTEDEAHCEIWRELAAMQEDNRMCHAMVVPRKSRMTGTERFKRLSEGSIGSEGVTVWNVKRKRGAGYEWINTPGSMVTHSEEIAKEWCRQYRSGVKMVGNQRRQLG